MSRLMLIGAVRRDQPAPPMVPPHLRLETTGWTGLALDLPDEMDLDEADDAAALAQAQHKILCLYVGCGDVLPIAMGAAFSDEGAARSHLEHQAEHLNALGARLMAQVEYCITLARAPRTEAQTRKARSGSEHLRQRRANRDRTRRVNPKGFLTQLTAEVERMSAQFRLRGETSSGRIGAIDILVKRDAWDHCAAVLDPWARQASDLGLSMTAKGPYPPFSFIGEAPGEGRA